MIMHYETKTTALSRVKCIKYGVYNEAVGLEGVCRLQKVSMLGKRVNGVYTVYPHLLFTNECIHGCVQITVQITNTEQPSITTLL